MCEYTVLFINNLIFMYGAVLNCVSVSRDNRIDYMSVNDGGLHPCHLLCAYFPPLFCECARGYLTLKNNMHAASL